MPVLRAVFDANVFISFLFSRNPESSVSGFLLDAAAEEKFILLIPIGAIIELNTVMRRPRVMNRVTQQQLELLLRKLANIGILLPQLEGELPRICRDPGDDYLIAAAVNNGADFLVSLDRDLLELEHVLELRIVDPKSFLAELSQPTS